MQPYEVVMPYAHLPEVDFTPDGAQVFEIAPGWRGRDPGGHRSGGGSIQRPAPHRAHPVGQLLPQPDPRGPAPHGPAFGRRPGENSSVLWYTGSDPDGAALKILGPTQATVERLGLRGGSFQTAESHVAF